jgi:hypothetical protein
MLQNLTLQSQNQQKPIHHPKNTQNQHTNTKIAAIQFVFCAERGEKTL